VNTWVVDLSAVAVPLGLPSSPLPMSSSWPRVPHQAVEQDRGDRSGHREED
jgi:hypothetical protein